MKAAHHILGSGVEIKQGKLRVNLHRPTTVAHSATPTTAAMRTE